MPYTQHGHAFGFIKAGDRPPTPVSRCGGPALCAKCRADVESYVETSYPATTALAGVISVLVTGELAHAMAESSEWSPSVQIKLVQHGSGAWEMLLRQPDTEIAAERFWSYLRDNADLPEWCDADRFDKEGAREAARDILGLPTIEDGGSAPTTSTLDLPGAEVRA